MKNLKKSIAIFLAFAIALTLNPLKSSAKWRDMSSNLPGYSDGPSTGELIIIIGGGAVIVGGLIYLIVKKKKQQPTSFINPTKSANFHCSMNQSTSNIGGVTNGDNDTAMNQVSPLFVRKPSLMQKLEYTAAKVPVNLIVAPINTGNNLALGNTNGVQVGLRIRF